MGPTGLPETATAPAARHTARTACAAAAAAQRGTTAHRCAHSRLWQWLLAAAVHAAATPAFITFTPAAAATRYAAAPMLAAAATAAGTGSANAPPTVSAPAAGHEPAWRHVRPSPLCKKLC